LLLLVTWVVNQAGVAAPAPGLLISFIPKEQGGRLNIEGELMLNMGDDEHDVIDDNDSHGMCGRC
jgi:hypothetical protein